MKQYFPFTNWLFQYNKSNFGGDVLAGLTVGVMLIPQGMAYAMLAGLPPIYGLYASTVPLFIYALMGTSRQLAVGPVAMVSLLIASGVGSLAAVGSPEYIQYAILLALMVGTIQFLMGVFRLGFLVNFLAHPVIAGFTSAAALIIGASQLKHLLGLSIPRGKVHETLIHIGQHWSEVHWLTFVIGLGAVIILLLFKKINKRIPAPLLIVLLGMGLVYGMGLDGQGVMILKEVPGGLPVFTLPIMDVSVMTALLPIALTISFVSFMESIAVAKALEVKHKSYKVIPNQELIGLGLANVFGAFFKAFPVTGGFSRTAVNDQAGAKTGLAAIISGSLIIITLLFLTPYFYYLPNAILAAIILVAVWGLIDFKEAKHLWKHDKRDFGIFAFTAIITLGVGIEEGILAGVVLSIILLVYQISYPHIAELGKVPGSSEFRNVKRFENLETADDLLVLRFDAPLFYANINTFKAYIDCKVAKNPNIRHIIIEASPINNLDSSAIHVLHDLEYELTEQGIRLYFSDVKGPVRDLMKRNDILNQENVDHFFLSTADAVDAIRNKKTISHEEFLLQTENEKSIF